MFTRKVVFVLSLLVLLVQGDLDSNDIGMDFVSTDKDTTSDEAPTESVSAISPDRPVVPANQVTAAEPAAASTSSVETEDEDENGDSGEDTKQNIRSRSARPQTRSTAQVHSSPRFLPISPVHLPESPALLPTQPIIPQPKAAVRSRASKRRSRTSRRQFLAPLIG